MDDVEQALHLLLNYGANPYANDIHGVTPSDMTCCQIFNHTLTWHWMSARKRDGLHASLKLLGIWVSALTEVSYDAEEVIVASIDHEECLICRRDARIWQALYGSPTQDWGCEHIDHRSCSKSPLTSWENDTRLGIPNFMECRASGLL